MNIGRSTSFDSLSSWESVNPEQFIELLVDQDGLAILDFLEKAVENPRESAKQFCELMAETHTADADLHTQQLLNDPNVTYEQRELLIRGNTVFDRIKNRAFSELQQKNEQDQKIEMQRKIEKEQHDLEAMVQSYLSEMENQPKKSLGNAMNPIINLANVFVNGPETPPSSLSGTSTPSPEQEIWSEEKLQEITQLHTAAIEHVVCKDLVCMVNRGNAYLGSKDFNDVKRDTIMGLSAGILMGGTVGVVVGTGVGFLVGDPISMGINGALCGYVIGASLSVPVMIAKTVKSNDYKNYLEYAKCKKVDETFHKYIKDDEILKKYLCPFTKDQEIEKIMEYPVKGLDNKTYEYANIKSWIDRRVAMGLTYKASIYGICDFELKDLEFDFHAFKNIALRINEIVHNDVNHLLNTGIIQQDKTKFLEENKKVMELVLNHEGSRNTKRWNDGDISDQRYLELQNKIKPLYHEFSLKRTI